MRNIFKNFITITRGSAEIPKTREVSTPPIREVEKTLNQVQDDKKVKIASDSLVCPYCASKNYIKRGFRQKKLERVQLMLCSDCGKTFTPHLVKGKHYPLATIFDAISLYNLGYSLEESCRRCRPVAEIETVVDEAIDMSQMGQGTMSKTGATSALGRIGTGTMPKAGRNVGIGTAMSASSLANWLNQFKDRMPFLRMRDFAMQKYSPSNMVTTATLAHRQLYRFRFHNAKCELIMQEDFHHKTFQPLKEFLEMVPGECPHQYFSAKDESFRASDLSSSSKSPIVFSKTAMIVRGKRNYATMMAEFVLQSVKDRTKRHEALQKYFLYNDSVTIATEVPVYLTNDDLEHMQTQLGFEIYRPGAERPATEVDRPLESGDNNSKSGGTPSTGRAISGADGLPRLVTGHIDFLQIRNGMIHILDYKPKAEKEKPIEQLTLYAMALSRLTGLRLFEFKCAWFDEKDYFEFYPLHVLHKPKKARKRKKVETQEGTYLVNKEASKIKSVRPI